MPSSRYQHERRKRTRLADRLVRQQQELNQRTDDEKAADEERRAETERAHFEATTVKRKEQERGYFWNGDVLCCREYGRVHQVAVYRGGRLMTFAESERLDRQHNEMVIHSVSG